MVNTIVTVAIFYGVATAKWGGGMVSTGDEVRNGWMA